MRILSAIPTCCPEPGGRYFRNLVRDRLPSLWYRETLLKMAKLYWELLEIEQ